MELNIKADLTQTLGVREMHDLMEINIRSGKKFECIFIDKKQAQQVIDKLQSWVGKMPDARKDTLHMQNVINWAFENDHIESDYNIEELKDMYEFAGEDDGLPPEAWSGGFADNH